MNIAIVTTEFVSENNFDGGLANYTYKLAKFLLQRGHQVTVYLVSKQACEYYFDDIKVIKVQMPDIDWKINYYLKRFRLDFLYPNKFRYKIQSFEPSFFLNRYLKERSRNERIDIIHYPNLAGLSFFRLKHISSIVRLSSSAIQCEKAGGYGDDKIKSKIMVKREYEAMKKADAVFGPSKMIAEETENIINKKITIIETPFLLKNIQLDYTLFDKTLRNKKYILFFGSIGLIKGVGTIANMIYPFLEEHRDCYFVFVGKKLNNQINSLNIWDYLMKNAAEHGSRIIHFEPLKHELLFPIIKNAACVVLPSITDNFPNTCIEAMANGKIVIGTQGNGFEQLINHEKSGYLIKVNDHLSLHSIINKIFALNERDKAEIEKNAISRIKLLSPDSIMPQIEEIYQLAIKLNDNKKTTKIYF